MIGLKTNVGTEVKAIRNTNVGTGVPDGPPERFRFIPKLEYEETRRGVL